MAYITESSVNNNSLFNLYVKFVNDCKERPVVGLDTTPTHKKTKHTACVGDRSVCVYAFGNQSCRNSGDNSALPRRLALATVAVAVAARA